MTPVPLRIVRSRSPAPASALLLPGGDAGEWLAEIASLGLAARDLRLFVVPRGAIDATAGALLVVSPEAQSLASVTGRALPLARRGARLLIPVDGRLWPPVEDAELDAALPRGLCLLHPVFGMVTFDDADALRVGDLVVPASRRDARWDAAHPGVRQPTLRGVHAAQTPSAEIVLEEGKGDASTQPLESLPPGPGEASEPLLKRVRNWLAKSLLRLTKNLPRTASEPTWVNHAESWASRALQADIEAQRAREIERLLHLLRTNPDIGLQFALPIGGMMTRGVAPPSGSLSVRNTEFDARALGGGLASDPWRLAREKTRDLTLLYREQAERAIRLGQHRRAAYVLANLLGDLRGAATALERGGHWREAAALYRERLKDPAAAAACLERGGLLTEAIALHLELGNRLQAATLLDRIGRRPEAEELWRGIVAERREAGDRVGAAALLATDLRVPDEALQMLDEGWPQGGQADSRLRSALDLLGRLGRGQDACRWVRRTRDARATPLVPVIDVLSGAAVTHPDGACRAEAADTVRVLVGSELSVNRETCDALLKSLVATDRGDRLLRRDATRFGAARKPAAKPVVRGGAGYETVGEFDLPALVPESMTVVPTRDGLLVCGTAAKGTGIEVHALGWDGRPLAARLQWQIVGPRGHRPFARIDEFSRRILVAFPGVGPRLFHQQSSDVGVRQWSVLTPAWVPTRVSGMCAGAALATWTVVELSDQEPVGYLATCHGQSGVTLRTATIRCDSGDDVVPIATVGTALIVATPRLVRVDAKGVLAELGAESVAKELVVAPRHLGATFVAVGESGCELWSHADRPDPAGQRFAEDADSPKVTFLGDGRIVVIERDRFRLFRREGDRVRCVLDQAGLQGRSVIALVMGQHEREVAAATTSAGGGKIRLLRLRFPVNV